MVSAFVPGRRSHAHLALGHAVVPDLEAQALTGGQWHTFPLNLRQGCQVYGAFYLSFKVLYTNTYTLYTEVRTCCIYICLVSLTASRPSGYGNGGIVLLRTDLWILHLYRGYHAFKERQSTAFRFACYEFLQG